MIRRKTEKCLGNHMNTERYMKSAIPAMDRALNKEELKRRKLLNISMAPENIVICNSISEKILLLLLLSLTIKALSL